MKKFNLFLGLVFVFAFAITSNIRADLGPTGLQPWYHINDVVYAGGSCVLAGSSGGLLRSGDNGVNFSTTLLPAAVLCFAYDATSNIVYIGTNVGVYYGLPTASTFTKATSMGNFVVNDIAVVGEGSITGKNRVIVSNGYKSDDNGLTWSVLSGFPYGAKIKYGGIINGNKVVFTAGSFVSRNENNGEGTWISMNTLGGLPNDPLMALSFSVVSSIPKLYVIPNQSSGSNIYVSSYSGGMWSGWSNISSGVPVIYEIRSLFTDGDNKVLAETRVNGIYRTENNGVSWITDNSGLLNLWITSIKTSPLYVFACTNGGGIYRRALPVNDKSSGTWTRCTITEWNPLNINWLNSMNSINGWTLTACTSGKGISVSTDNGLNWNWSNSGLTSLDVQQTIDVNNVIFAATRGGVHKSTNYGTSWIISNNGITDSIINCFARVSSLLFAGTDSKGVFSSTNYGTNWVTRGLSNMKVKKLTIMGNFVYAAISSGVSRTTNDGVIWEAPSLLDSAINGFAIRGSSLYAVSGINGVFVSTNYGVNWSSFNTGLTSTKINTILSKNNILYVGTKDAGLFKASTGNWESTNINSGIYSLNITALGSDSNNIYIGDNCGLIYSGPFSSIVNIESKNNELPSDYNLSQNYPNPFNPITNIRYQIANNSFVTLKIYDILGKEIETLINEKLSPGTYEMEWNASKFATGIYLYQIKAGEYIETKKMILLK